MISCVLYFSLLLFNPNSPSFLLSLLGLKNYILYFPVAFLVPYCIRDFEDFELQFKRYAILVLPALLLPYLQFSLPSTHHLNSYVTQVTGVESITAQFGSGSNKVRTAGMFSYLSGNLSFTLFIATCSFGLLAAKNFTLKRNVTLYLIFVLAMGAMFTTGSRTGLLALVILGATVIGSAISRGFVSPAVLARLIGAATISTIGIIWLSRDAFGDLINRAKTVTDTNSRLASPFIETYHAFQNAPLGGTGLASTHNGLINSILGKTIEREWLGGVALEVESARILLETGILGFILFMGLKLSIIFFSFKQIAFSKTTEVSMLAAAYFCWFSFHLILYIVTHPTAALYYYFSLGVLFAINRFR